MHNQLRRLRLARLLTLLALQACAPFPASIQINGGVNVDATALAATISMMQLTLSALQTPPSPLPTATASLTEIPIPTNLALFLTPSPFPTFNPYAKNSTVIHDALCWLGPGRGYEVSSAILAGTRVTLLGWASIGGWWIVENPTYHDPCWIYQEDLQIDFGLNPYSLRVFYPPPTLTPTATSTSTPTRTPTP